MKKIALLLIALAVAAQGLLAQQASAATDARAGQATSTSTTNSSSTQAAERLQLAMSSIDYPVTPSDTYVLTYRQSTGETQTKTILVASDYSIDLGIFGKIDATKMSFVDLKKRVENLYAESYARSYPSLTIQSVGAFRVSVSGEISRSKYITAWGLSRLSDVLTMAEAPNASMRIVNLKSRSSSAAVRYDVLKAMRLGSTDQDPLVKPDDVVTLFPAGRIIKLTGEVREAGNFELQKNEGLKELIEQFGGGLTPRAEPLRVRIDRITKTGPASEYVSLPKAYDTANIDDCIAVNVPSKLENLPVVWFEGAVQGTAATAAAAGTETQASAAAAQEGAAQEGGQGTAAQGTSTRISVQISEGELLSDALQQVRGRIMPMADLASASLFRQGSPTPIAVNLQPLLATSNPSADVPLKPYDRIFIPTLKSTVRVAGAVLAPGSFPYQPNSPAAHYIGLAGGSDPLKNEKGVCLITDALGNFRSSAQPVQAGDQIYVLSNLAGITVSGAVTIPGVYSYQAGLAPPLYINQAGGIDPSRGTGSYRVTDLEGKLQDKGETLSPGDRIYVSQNKLSYNITTYLPVITGVISLAMSIISLNQLLKAN
jgi:polysaccharide biosynthesis/export protein